jgi:ADP-ribose pyrophosphatase
MRDFTKKTLWQGKFLHVIGKEFENRNGTRGLWESVERTNSREIVAIFPVTKDKEVVLTKQFRFPLEAYAVESPAGLSDKAGEDLEATARRELWEETGYRAGKMIKIAAGPFNSGMSGDVMVIFYAPDVEYAGGHEEAGDDSEEIEVVKVPLSEFYDFCTRPHDGFMVDIKLLANLKILEEKKLI